MTEIDKQSEQEPALKRLEFVDVKPRDIIRITTGVGSEAWEYSFDVEETKGRWPTGYLGAVMPDGTELPVIPFSLHGCGHWTTRKQNPVQTQERAFSPYYDGLIVGDFMWGMRPGESERDAFIEPGQEISSIVVDRRK